MAYANQNEVAAILAQDGISRPNRYEVALYPPRRLTGGNRFDGMMEQALGDGTVRMTGLKCESISFPGQSLNTKEDTNIYGPIRKIVSGVSYGDVSATFQCDSRMREKLYFEAWQSLAYNPDTFAVGYYRNYVGSIDISAIADTKEEGGPPGTPAFEGYGVRLIEAFPVSIIEQGLSYQNGGTYLTLTVNFAYRHWKNLTTDLDSLGSPLESISDSGIGVDGATLSHRLNAAQRRLLG